MSSGGGDSRVVLAFADAVDLLISDMDLPYRYGIEYSRYLPVLQFPLRAGQKES
jgi:hypothetical protein